MGEYLAKASLCLCPEPRQLVTVKLHSLHRCKSHGIAYQVEVLVGFALPMAATGPPSNWSSRSRGYLVAHAAVYQLHTPPP
jgi:hypothetical protein